MSRQSTQSITIVVAPGRILGEASAFKHLPMTPEQERRKQELELVLGPLYKMKPQRVPAYWQCILLVAKPEFQTTDGEAFVPPTMAASAICLECGDGIKYRPSGNAIVEHMKAKHNLLLLNYRDSSPRKRSKQKKRRSSEGGSAAKTRRDLNKEEDAAVKRLAAMWIARRMRPIVMIEDPELQDLCDLLGEFGGFSIELPKRAALRDEIVTMASELRENLKDELAAHAENYCLTTDIWTDQTARSYMSLTVHFVDANFKIHNKLLGVSHFPGKHDAVRIGNKITELLVEWNLDKEKCTMMVRGGAANAVKGTLLACVPSMSCIAHSLQLVLAGALMRSRKPPRPKAKAGKPGKKKSKASQNQISTSATEGKSTPPPSTSFEPGPGDEMAEDREPVNESETDNDDDIASTEIDHATMQRVREAIRTEVDDHVTKETTAFGKRELDKARERVALFRKIATYFRRSPKAKNGLSRIQINKAKDVKGVILDCPTRWSSTFLMLNRFEEIKTDLDGFFTLLKTDKGKQEFSDSVLTETPSNEDWFYIQCMTTLLQPFADVTKRLSGEGYPTFTAVFPYLRMMKEYLQNDRLFAKGFAAVAKESFAEDIVDSMQNVRQALFQLFRQRFRGLDEELMWVPLLDPRLADMTYLDGDEEERARDCLIRAMIALQENRAPESPVAQSTRPSFFSPQPAPPSVIDMFDARLYGKKKAEPAQVSGRSF